MDLIRFAYRDRTQTHPARTRPGTLSQLRACWPAPRFQCQA